MCVYYKELDSVERIYLKVRYGKMKEVEVCHVNEGDEGNGVRGE